MSASGVNTGDARHTRWVKISHWIVAASFLTLAVSGFVILMAHPRLYWGETGNDLTPALIELPISRNFQHSGWSARDSFFSGANSPVTSSRTYEIFNQNGWARSLHFLAAWLLVVPGAIYLLAGIITGHFWRHFVPRRDELNMRAFGQEVYKHLRLLIRDGTGGPQYGLLQKCAYGFVVFVALPLAVLTGLAMSPAITAAYPMLLDLFGGFQSARTIHFFDWVFLVMFLLVHVVMIIKSGFKRQIRAMTFGERP
jgi:thiosulfate reductase cytochrome b subunit